MSKKMKWIIIALAVVLVLEVLTALDSDETTVKTFDYAKLLLGTSVSMKNLKIVDIYTTSNEDSSSKGAMTLTCQAEGATVTVQSYCSLK